MKLLFTAATLILTQWKFATAFPTRLNLGATEAWVDPDGNTWEPDSLSTGTSIGECPGPFFWTNLASLVCSRKEWETSSGNIEIAVPNPGFYEATLYFSEANGKVGDRAINVAIEGVDIYEDLDVVAVTGYPTSFFTLRVKYFITDGSYTIKVYATKGKPVLAGIQVVADGSTSAPVAPPPPPPPSPQLPGSYFINIGSLQPYAGESGQVWQADSIATGTAVDKCDTLSFQGLENPGLFCKYREWAEQGSSGVLEFPVSPSTYRLRLYISETSAAVGERLVNVLMEGQQVATDLDVADRIGGSYGLYTLTVTGFIADGSISIELQASKGSPVLAAVEIVDPSAPPPPAATIAPTTKPTPSPTFAPTLSPVTTAPTPAVVQVTSLPTSSPIVVTLPPVTLAPISNAPVSMVPVSMAPVSMSPISMAPVSAAPVSIAPVSAPPVSIAPVSVPPISSSPVSSAPVSAAPVAKITAAPALTPPTGGFSLRVNTGSFDPFVDADGNTWQVDQSFGGGSTFAACPSSVSGTPYNGIYCSERWGSPAYSITVPTTGYYKVVTHFAEIFYQEPNLRVFDVVIQGEKVKTLDIVGEVGPNAPYTLETIAEAVNNLITIDMKGLIENPKISGFEVIELGSSFVPPTASPTSAPDEVALINCGGPEYVDSLGRVWAADTYSVGGSTYVDGSNDVVSTTDDLLYHSERNGQFAYEIPVGSGKYDVILHFAELFWTLEGQRVFNVSVESTANFPGVDIIALGAGEQLKAVELTAVGVDVVDGFLTISFTNATPQKDSPKVSMIEVKRSAERRMLRRSRS